MRIKVIFKYDQEFMMDSLYGIDSVFPAKLDFGYRRSLIWRYIGRGA